MQVCVQEMGDTLTDVCVCVCVDADGGARTPGDTLTGWNVCVDTDGGVCRCRWRCVYMC